MDLFDQEPHAGAVEEGQVAEPEKLPQADNLFIERLGAIDVARRERDLSDLADVEQHGASPLETQAQYVHNAKAMSRTLHRASLVPAGRSFDNRSRVPVLMSDVMTGGKFAT
jgi:hypothetical protein